jgi:ERCC4-type nuclease
MAKEKATRYTIIKDTREQTGYYFSKYNLCDGMIERKLDTGDYAIDGLEDQICVERKSSVAELAINLGQKKHAFLAEINRMKTFEHKYIVLEFSMADLAKFPEGTNIPQKARSGVKITGRYMLRCLMEFEIYDDVNVIFAGDKENAFMFISSLFKRMNEKYSIGRQK